jgi:hypothetical protein
MLAVGSGDCRSGFSREPFGGIPASDALTGLALSNHFLLFALSAAADAGAGLTASRLRVDRWLRRL